MGGSKSEPCPQTGLVLAQNGIHLYFCKAGAHSAQIPAKLGHGGAEHLHKYPEHTEVKSLQGVPSTHPPRQSGMCVKKPRQAQTSTAQGTTALGCQEVLPHELEL